MPKAKVPAVYLFWCFCLCLRAKNRHTHFEGHERRQILPHHPPPRFLLGALAWCTRVRVPAGDMAVISAITPAVRSPGNGLAVSAAVRPPERLPCDVCRIRKKRCERDGMDHCTFCIKRRLKCSTTPASKRRQDNWWGSKFDTSLLQTGRVFSFLYFNTGAHSSQQIHRVRGRKRHIQDLRLQSARRTKIVLPHIVLRQSHSLPVLLINTTHSYPARQQIPS